MAYGLLSTQDGSRREDLLDLLGDVSPDETPLLTLFGTSTAKDTIHQWTELYQSRPTSVSADVEGSDTTFDDLTPPSRVSNVTQIIKRGIRVSRTERAVNVAAVGDPFAFQKADQLRLLKMDMEYALLNAAKASGASGVAAQMDGIDAFITSRYLLWKSICSKIKLWLFTMIARIAELSLNIKQGEKHTISFAPAYVQL